MFTELIKPLRGKTNLHGHHTELRLDNLLYIINKINNSNDQSPILEFGIGSGYSLANMKALADKFNMPNQFIGFDSFEGLPHDEANHWKKGEFAHPYEKTIKSFNGLNNYKLIKGFYNESLTKELKNYLNITSASLIHIDCDLYSSTVFVLTWVKSLIKSGTYIVFDEYIFGENKAWEEFLIENPSISYKIILPGEEQRILQIINI